MSDDDEQPEREPVPRAWREEFDGLNRSGRSRTKKPAAIALLLRSLTAASPTRPAIGPSQVVLQGPQVGPVTSLVHL